MKSPAELPMQVFLKAGDVDVKPKNFRGEGMLTCKFFRTLNTTLPGGNRHRPIISSVVQNSKWTKKCFMALAVSGLWIISLAFHRLFV